MHELYGRVWVAAIALDTACGLLEYHGKKEPPEPRQCIAGPAYMGEIGGMVLELVGACW